MNATDGRAGRVVFTESGPFTYVPYSTYSNGAPCGSPSQDSATRSPVPVIMITSELPLDHPGRSTISLMIEARFGVRWLGPAVPVDVHGTGDQDTKAVV